MKKEWKLCILLAYAAFMFWLLYGKRFASPGEVGLQLQPLYTLQIYWQALLHTDDPLLRWQSFANLFGNVVLFVPMGFFAPWISAVWQKFWQQLLLMVTLIIAVEVTQLATGLGWCDVDDLILNVLGTSLGFLLWRLCWKETK